MASFDLEEPTDPDLLASGDGPDPRFSNGCSEGLGLLVWLGQLAREESARWPANHEVAESIDPPRAIGRFQLEVLLGAGAYGAVFRALDTHLGRHVALKLAWPGVLMDPVSSRRFVEEPKITASLKHRGIVEVYDSGEIEMACFIALELVDGPTLAEWFKNQEHVSVRLAAQIVRSVAATIHFAHERGVIHRDLKPSNILLRPCGNGESFFPYEPVVTDFGLARRPRTADVSMATGTQAIIGTDQYMSPEQAAGRTSDVGTASDIFSLGVMLYELIAGRRPFDGESSDQIRQRIQEDEPPSIRPWRKSVAKDLETIMLKCLEKSPNRRYESAQDLADDLQRFLDNKPIQARPVAVWQRVWKYTKRKPLVVSFVSLAMASVLAVAALLGAWAADRTSAAHQIASAEAAASVTEGLERQHQYAANIQHAAEAMRRSGRQDVLDLLEQCRAIAQEPVHCGIEWDYLWTQANDFDQTLAASDESIHSLRFSPSGDLLISAGEDGRVILWDTATWTKRSELNDEVGEVRIAEPSPNGSLLAVAGEDGRVVVHRIADGTIIFDEPIVRGRIFALTWLGQNTRLAVGGQDAIVSVIDPMSHERRSTAPLLEIPPREQTDSGHPVEIAALAYFAQCDTIGVAMKPSGIQFLEAATLAPASLSIRELPYIGFPFCDLPLKSGYFSVRTRNTIVSIRRITDGSKVAEFPVRGPLRSLRHSTAAGVLVGGFRDGTVQTWDIESILAGQRPAGRTFCAHSGRAATAEFSPDGTWLASGGEDGKIRLWRRQCVREPFDVTLEDAPWVIEFSPCGRWMAARVGPASRPGRVIMFDARSGEGLWASKPDERPESRNVSANLSESRIAFDPTGSDVIFMDPDSSIHGYNPGTGQVTRTYSTGGNELVTHIQISPDCQSIILFRPEATIVVDRSSNAVVERVEQRLRPDLGFFRTTLGDVWVEHDITQKRVLLRTDHFTEALLALEGPAERTSVAAVSDDGRYLAIGGADRIVYFWDLKRPGPPAKCIGHEGAINNLLFSQDNRTILSHSYDDGTVRFWHVATRAELLKLGTPDQPILCMGLNPAGNLLVLGIVHDGRYGLQIHRLGPNRDSMPKSFDLSEAKH